MGSMGKDIIVGTGDWSFGVARWVYNPLILQLGEIGYRVGENLFVCHYDWRKRNKDTMKTYLKPMIKQVRERFPHHKIDLLCHSMGGLVARSYIQSYDFQYDIDKLIMLGTPQQGAIAAYYLWSTGRVMLGREHNHFYHILAKGYTWILLRLLNVSQGLENLEKIHETFPSIGELIPSMGYGNILCYEDSQGKWQTVPRDFMRYQNYFLDELNESSYLLSHRVKSIYSIIGYDFSTAEYLMIDEKKFFNEHEEIILDSLETLEGDGTVVLKSAMLHGYQHYFIKADHKDIVSQSYPYIKEIYISQPLKLPEETKVMEELTLHLLFTGNPNIIVERDEKVVAVIKEGSIMTSYNYLHEKYPGAHQWIIVKGIEKGIYRVKVDNVDEKNIEMIIMAEGLREVDKKEEIKAYERNYQFYLEVY